MGSYLGMMDKSGSGGYTKLMNWVSDVPSKLATLEVEDPRFQRFGAFMHQYHLGPKMSEAELSATERALQIQLPEDYRNFLLVVGNGGAGPGYGLQRFGHPRQLAERTPTRPAPRGYSITYSREGIEYPAAQFANCFDDLYWGGIESIGENASSVARPFRLVDSAYRNGWMFWEPNFQTAPLCSPVTGAEWWLDW